MFTDALADLDPHALDGFQETDAVAPILQRNGAVDRTGPRPSCSPGSPPRPGCCWLDDLHWADPASLELLDHLVRHPVHAPSRPGRDTP
ncbi:hypothetical protein [Streptomyces doebereineriae]|uniref:Uncharacterized protein n=1 Tax=Streptomyces doebereineriae TaxID=3075528 RepID=A0ABU2VFI5_9ACTN|nr:hypothetical protein [Streptomyces sp. DSM 41640]MDT0484030.1 hypothetical protein [Streptomyces sp. DSM 41640]